MRIVARNLVALFCSQVATWASALLMLILLPRFLGDAQFGRLSFAWSFVALFGTLAGLGTGQFITKATARDGTLVRPYVWNDLIMKLPLIVLLSFIAVIAAGVLGYPKETRLLVTVACLSMGLGVLKGTLVAGLQGRQDMRWPAIWLVVEQYASSAATIAALLARVSLVAVGLASTSTGILSLVANSARLFGLLRDRPRIDLRLWKTLALGGFPFLTWNLALLVYSSIDISMLSYMAGDAVVGWYVLAFRMTGLIGTLPVLFMTATFPTLSKYGTAAPAALAGMTNRGIRLVYFVSAPIAAGISLIVADVIPLLHYPESFNHSIPLVRILAPYVVMAGIGTIIATAIIAFDRQRQWVIVGCLTAVLNPMLNLVAIPLTSHSFGDGAIGAAVVTVVTELIMLIGAVCLRPPGVLDGPTIAYMGRCTLACMPILALEVVAGHAPLLVTIVLGASAYGLTSLILRTISVRELTQTCRALVRQSAFRGASAAS